MKKVSVTVKPAPYSTAKFVVVRTVNTVTPRVGTYLTFNEVADMCDNQKMEVIVKEK